MRKNLKEKKSKDKKGKREFNKKPLRLFINQ